jgi:hypothetical protein
MKNSVTKLLVVKREKAHQKALCATQDVLDKIKVYEAANQGFSPDNLIEEHFNCEQIEDHKRELLQQAIIANQVA